LAIGPRRPWASAQRSRGVGLILSIWAPDASNDYSDFTVSEREAVSRVSIAQAEYYSDWQYANRIGDAPLTRPFPGVMVEEDTFYMHWRARLRRVRAPVDAAPEALDAGMDRWTRDALHPECQSMCEPIGDCGALCDALLRFRGVGGHVLH
jgi:hypothetical protein